MTIKKIQGKFTVCKVIDYSGVNFESEFCFIGKTDEEKSLVCLTEDTPENTIEREDGWSALRVEGILDFSLTGILAKISAVLAKAEIGIFAISTFNTDYILVKVEDEMKAMSKLAQAGYKVLTGDPYGDYFINRTATNMMSEYSEQQDEWKSME